MLICPICSHSSEVIDSRQDPSGIKRRRRQCSNCNKKWTTFEVTEDEYDLLKFHEKLLDLSDRDMRILKNIVTDMKSDAS